MNVDINDILKTSEHEISYGSKRAIEMYYPVWEKGPALNLFEKCAEHYHLCKGEIEKCINLMNRMGMNH